MNDMTKLERVDLESATIIGTSIEVLFAIIASAILLIIGGVLLGGNLVLALLPAASTLIFGILMYYIYSVFMQFYLYNSLTKSKLNPISFKLKDNETVEFISVLPTAVTIGVIFTIMLIIIYLASIFIVPLLMSTVVQTLMFAGQMEVGYAIYELMMVYSNTTLIFFGIIMAFITAVVVSAVFCALYNAISPKTAQLKFKFGKSGDMTTIEYVNPLNLAIITSIIMLIIQLVSGMLNFITTGAIMGLLVNTVSGFISTFVVMYLMGAFYNLLSKKFGPVKIKLS